MSLCSAKRRPTTVKWGFCSNHFNCDPFAASCSRTLLSIATVAMKFYTQVHLMPLFKRDHHYIQLTSTTHNSNPNWARCDAKQTSIVIRATFVSITNSLRHISLLSVVALRLPRWIVSLSSDRFDVWNRILPGFTDQGSRRSSVCLFHRLWSLIAQNKATSVCLFLLTLATCFCRFCRRIDESVVTQHPSFLPTAIFRLIWNTILYCYVPWLTVGGP